MDGREQIEAFQKATRNWLMSWTSLSLCEEEKEFATEYGCICFLGNLSFAGEDNQEAQMEIVRQSILMVGPLFELKPYSQQEKRKKKNNRFGMVWQVSGTDKRCPSKKILPTKKPKDSRRNG